MIMGWTQWYAYIPKGEKAVAKRFSLNCTEAVHVNAILDHLEYSRLVMDGEIKHRGDCKRISDF
jgi:hypothetical protein